MNHQASDPPPSATDSPERAGQIEQYLPLVRYVTGRLAVRLPSVLDYEDLISYGTIGLIEAIGRFDDSKGVKFETYAITRIRGAIIDAMRALDPVPRSSRQKMRQIDAATATLLQELGRQPTDVEIAAAVGVPVEHCRRTIVDAGRVTISLDADAGRDDDHDHMTMEAVVADPDIEDFATSLVHEETLREVTAALEQLPERDAVLLSLYYREELTMREIAVILGISESRVCQLHSRVLARLKMHLADEARA